VSPFGLPQLWDKMGLLTKYGQKSRKYDIIRGKGVEGMQLKYHMITIEDLVPENHFLRKVEMSLALSLYMRRPPIYTAGDMATRL